MVKMIHVGIGLGGSRHAMELSNLTSKDNDNVILINMSREELLSVGAELDDSDRILIGKSHGAGKDRNVGLEAIKTSNHKNIVSHIVERINSHKALIVTVSFSTGGGTGSSVGPILTTLLNSNKINNATVIGFPLLPAFDEGLLNFGNTILCIDHIKTSINKNNVRYALVTNDTPNAGNSITKVQETSNRLSANQFVRYFKVKYSDDGGVLDLNDRLRGISNPGLHAFTLLRDLKLSDSQFINPNASTVKMILAEIPDTVEDYERSLSVFNFVDKKYGYNGSDSGIVGFHGFFNIDDLILPYYNRLNELIARNEESGVKTSSTDLDIELDNVKGYVNSVTSETKSDASADDILNEFN